MQWEWMQAGIETKANINKSLEINQKEMVAKAKGKGISDCLGLWTDATEKAGDFDKRGYLNWIKQIKGVEDPNYDNLIQINSAVNNNKSWIILKGIIECLL